MIGRVLVAGFATRHIVQSAYAAGYEVYAVDHFCDQDLMFYAREAMAFAEPGDLEGAVVEMCERYHPDLIVPASGAEALVVRCLCGTPPEKVGRFLDKLSTHRFFEETGIPTPELLSPGKYPAMLKPRKGSGGWRNAVVHDDSGFSSWTEKYGDLPYLSEEVVHGVPSSVCCLATGSSAVAVAVNRQMLRGNGDSAFGFSGSVTPFQGDAASLMIRYAEHIAEQSGCTGTIGIDFVAGDRIHAIEVNPRFQATLDTIEIATGRNLFSAHVEACRGNLPARRPICRQVAARTILFAGRDMVLGPDLVRLSPLIADIPRPGACFEEGQALLSVYGWGAGYSEAMAMLDKHIRTVQQYMGGRLYG
ncbi:MAG: ATP-grasp domain-containing protein [Methanoregulaceae archaeon]|nr:ATP-grasp domain-containing protein [Methanoregulaceae archaeon]